MQEREGLVAVLPVPPTEVLTWATEPFVSLSVRSSPVRTPVRSPPARSLAYLSDDQIEPYPQHTVPLFRIGCIGDGSCFFHAVLKGISPTYQTQPSERRALAIGLRHDLATALGMVVDPRTGATLYDTLPVSDLSAFAEEGLDFSLKGMQALLTDPSQFVGDEVYALVSRLLSVSLIVVNLTPQGLIPQHTVITNPADPFIVVALLSGDREHFELLATARPDGLATVFRPTDPLIMSLK